MMSQPSKKKGLFLTFEGGEGSGKSTQIKKTAQWLSELGLPIVTTREPGGTPGAEEVRKLLVEGAPERWDSMTEALLLFAGRRNHLKEFILPYLQEGTWVLCDRFTDSSWVYQGYAGGIGGENIEALARIALGDFKPNYTLILDLPPEVGLQRAHSRLDTEDRFEKKGTAFHLALYEGYHQLAKNNPERCFLISALGSEDEVFKRIVTFLKTYVLS